LLRRVLHESVGGLYLLLGRNDEGRAAGLGGMLEHCCQRLTLPVS